VKREIHIVHVQNKWNQVAKDKKDWATGRKGGGGWRGNLAQSDAPWGFKSGSREGRVGAEDAGWGEGDKAFSRKKTRPVAIQASDDPEQAGQQRRFKHQKRERKEKGAQIVRAAEE